MSKKKTKRTSHKSAITVERSNTEKPSIKKLSLSLGKWIGAMLLIYLIMFIIFTVYNYFSIKNHGYNSSNEVINKYITSMMDMKSSKMDKCINYEAINSYNVRTLNKSYVNILKQMNITFDKNNIEIKESKYDKIDDIKKEFSEKTTIDNANSNLVYLYFTETIDGDEFDGLIEYEIITYETNGKWYVFDMKQNEMATVLSSNNEYMTIGDNTLGYIALNKHWIPTNTNILEGTISSTAYISPNNTAIISLNVIESKLSYNEYIDNFTTSLTNNKINYIIEDRTINDISMKYVYYTTTDENNTKIHQCKWFFQQPMRDGYIHCITFDCNDSGQYATNYIEMFHY